MIYIGATAKSGTHYTTEFLNRLGLRIGHEYPSYDGIVTWYTHHSPEHYPDKLHINIEEHICLHQTREPLTTINSILKLDMVSWRYIRCALQMDLTRPLLDRAMEYYYKWNLNLENCTFQYQVEQIEDLIEILDLFDVEYDRSKIDFALKTPRLGQTQDKPQLTWKDLYNQNFYYANLIEEKAEIYGY